MKNIVEIDSLGEDMKKITLKVSPIKKEKSKIDEQGEVKRLKWSQHNHFQRIKDLLQIIPRISS